MASTLKRLIGVVGSSAIIAGAAIVAAPSAHADGDYYGTWTLTALKERDQKTKCTGALSKAANCPGGQTLTLKSNYRYKTSDFLSLLFATGQKGYFDVATLPSTGQDVLVLESDSRGVLALGSAWALTLSGGGSGSPTKMMLALETGLGEITMVYRRDSA